MSGHELEQLIRERNKLRIELARERIIAMYRHKAYIEMWSSDGKKPAAFSEWFFHHQDFDTYMRSVPAFAIDTEPRADHSEHWRQYLLFVDSWKKNAPEHTFMQYLEVLTHRYDMMEQD